MNGFILKFKALLSGVKFKPLFLISIIFALCAFLVLMRFQIFCAVNFMGERVRASEIMDTVKDFDISSTKRSDIYYTSGDEKYIPLMQSMIKTYYPLICRDFGVSPNNRVTLIIYPTKNALFSAIGGGEGASVPMGAYSSGILIVLSPSFWLKGGADSVNIDYFIKNGPIIHEMAHLVFDRAVKGNYKQWLSEGIALYIENKYTGFVWNAAKKENSPPIDERVSYRQLCDNFKYITERESYRKSYEIVRYITEKYGDGALLDICTELERGQSLDKTMKRLFPSDIEFFDLL